MTLNELKSIREALRYQGKYSIEQSLKLIQREIDRKEINPVTNLPYKKDQINGQKDKEE